MDMSNVKKIFRGVGVIIDDDVEADGTPANALLKSIQSENIPIVASKMIPDISMIDCFGNISFIILDWDFSKNMNVVDIEGVSIGDTLQQDQRQTILEFLQELLQKVFVPVFLLTGQQFSNVKDELQAANLYSDEKPNRIMLKAKSEVSDYDMLMGQIQQWIESTPSACVLKLWENEAVQAKNRMFLDMYAASPNWVYVLIDALRKDTENNELAVNHDFVEILNNNLINRVLGTANYNAIGTNDRDKISSDEISKVLQGGRYITYASSDDSDVCYTGDLYLKRGNNCYPFCLNIRAQCDLIRKEDPVLYLVYGKVVDSSEIVETRTIKLKGNNKDIILAIGTDEYNIEELLKDKKARRSFNEAMNKNEGKLLFQDGAIIEKKNNAYVTCIAGERVIEFCFNTFEAKRKSELENEADRIGRLLPPYITRIQNSVASYIVRTGVMRVPRELIGDSRKEMG